MNAKDEYSYWDKNVNSWGVVHYYITLHHIKDVAHSHENRLDCALHSQCIKRNDYSE